MFLSWWNHTDRKEKFIQILVFFLIFGASLDLNGSLFGAPMGLAGFYILYDCIKRKSLAGFYLPIRYWLPLAVFMGTVMLASLILGDGPSIRIAFQNVYWCLPFIVATYLGKQADIKYAALLGAMASVLVSSVDLLYLTQCLGIKGRVGAFGKISNYHALLLLGVLPVVFAAFQDGRIRALKKFYILRGIVALLGLWSLWRTGSRGAMIGFLFGGILTYGVICFYQKRFKQFLTGLTVCFALAAFVLLVGIPGGEIRNDAARLRLLRSSYAMWQDHQLAGVGLANWQKEFTTNYLLKEEIEAEALQRYQAWKKAAEQRAAAKKAAAQKAAAKKAEEQRKAASQKATGTKAAAPKPKPQLTAAQKAAAARNAAAARKAAAQKAEAVKKAAAEREAKQIAAWKQAAIKRATTESIMPHNVIAWFFSTTGSIGGIGYLFFVCCYIWMFCNELKRSNVSWIDAAGLWVFLAITIHGMVDAGIIYKAIARLLYLVMGLSISYYSLADRQRIPEEGGGSNCK